MMELLEVYARQVVSYHPASQREELFAEIYDGLCEEFDDWLGANPGLGEADFLNQSKQHPIKYATQLAVGESAYLVGPGFYFSFLSALKTAFAIVVIFHIVVGVATAFASGNIWGAFLGAISSIPGTFLWVGAAVLGVFVALEKSGEKATWLDKWDANNLKPDSGRQPISRLETSFDLGIAVLALLLILDILEIPMVVHHDGEWVRDWVIHVPEGFWLAAGILLLFDIGFALFRLSRTFWSQRLRAISAVSNCLWLVMLIVAASQGQLVSVDHPEAAGFVPIINTATKVGLLIACIIVTWDTLVHAWHLLKSRQIGSEV